MYLTAKVTFVKINSTYWSDLQVNYEIGCWKFEERKNEEENLTYGLWFLIGHNYNNLIKLYITFYAYLVISSESLEGSDAKNLTLK